MSFKNPSAENERRKSFLVGANDDDRRVDVVVKRLLPAQNLARLQKALREGDIRLEGKKIGPDTRLHAGMRLEIWRGLLSSESKTKPFLLPLPPEFESWIVEESKDLLVVNKPSGVLVHPGDRHESTGLEPTLDSWVRTWLTSRGSEGLSFRPGPLHRLDRPTSGLVVFSASLRGARQFSSWLASGCVKKIYLALLEGNLTKILHLNVRLERLENRRITLAAGENGREASTEFHPLAHKNDATLALVELENGRTHQIRAHAASAGFPLIGDRKYGSQKKSPNTVSWWLHAWSLRLPDSSLGQDRFLAPLPTYWQNEAWIAAALEETSPWPTP